MKAKHQYLKLFSKLLILILLFQSCSIYRSKSVSVDRAVEFNRKVKLTTDSHQVFRFKSLEREGDQLIGIARANSKAAQLLAEDIVEENYRGNFIKIEIPEDAVEEIKLKNYKLSEVVSIVVVVAILVGFSDLISNALFQNPLGDGNF